MLINLRNALMSGKRLPYDAEAEYLESTGTQWIDTGVVPTNTTGVLIECTVPTNNSRDNVVVGARQSSDDTRYWIDFDWSTYDTFYFGFGSLTPRAYNSLRQYEGERVQVGMNYQNGRICTVNGEKFSNLPISGSLPTITKSIYCFRANYSNPYTYSGKIFSLKITDGLTLVRDYIPVRKGTVGYLYDRVSGKLFGNAGTGDFVVGPDVVPVEWLESDGNQYIDTGVKPDATYTFDSTVAVMQSNYNCTYWGCRSSGSYLDINNQCYLASNTSGSSQSIYYYIRLISTNAGNDSNWNSGIIPETGRMYDFSGITTVSTMNAMTYPVVLFGLNIYGTVNSASGKVRIAKWTPYKSGVRVNDFRAVRVGTEGAMMDVLTRRIYRNAGTGAFAYGNDLKYPIPAE